MVKTLIMTTAKMQFSVVQVVNLKSELQNLSEISILTIGKVT